MGLRYTLTLIEILRKTLRDVEASSDGDRNDPAVLQLKRSIARTIAELEVAKLERMVA